jgi:hypothetical protein
LKVHIIGLESFTIPFQVRDLIIMNDATPDYLMLKKLDKQVERILFQLNESIFVFQ